MLEHQSLNLNSKFYKGSIDDVAVIVVITVVKQK